MIVAELMIFKHAFDINEKQKQLSHFFFQNTSFILENMSPIDFELKKGPASPLGNLVDISYLKENVKPHLLRDVCTLCSGALVSDSLLHMLL